MKEGIIISTAISRSCDDCILNREEDITGECYITVDKLVEQGLQHCDDGIVYKIRDIED